MAPTLLGIRGMTFAPLFAAPIAVILHALAAMAAFGLGLVQFAAPKGTLAAFRTFCTFRL